MSKPTFAILVAVASLAMVSTPRRAAADEAPGTITLKTTTVVGAHRRPSVVIEVTRAKPEIKLKDLQDPKVEKIMRAAANAPF